MLVIVCPKCDGPAERVEQGTLDHIKELETQVDRLRAAIRDMTFYLSRADYYNVDPQTLEVLREING